LSLSFYPAKFTINSHKRGEPGVFALSPESTDFEEDFLGFDVELRRPPTALLYIGIVFVILGMLIGIYSIFTSGATNFAQFLLGGIGYLCTAVFPIIILQVLHSKHRRALKENQDLPYDIYGGNQLESRFRKVVLFGLLVTVLPLWVFFQPIAERFAT